MWNRVQSIGRDHEGHKLQTAKFLQPLHDNPELNFGEHVDQYLANLERERR